MKYLREGVHNYGKLTVVSKLSKEEYERKEDYYVLYLTLDLWISFALAWL